MDGRAADMPPAPAHMEKKKKTLFLSCSCRAPCFGQRFSFTVTSRHDVSEFCLCRESLCFGKGGGKHTNRRIVPLTVSCSCLSSTPPNVSMDDIFTQSWCLWLCIIYWISSCINRNAFWTFYCVGLCVPHKGWFWFWASWLFVYVVSAHFMWCWWFQQL